MAVSQSHYRVGVEAGTESTHGWYAPEDVSFVPILVGVTFLLRFTLQCDATQQANVDPEFQYNKNGAGWNAITTTSAVAKAVTPSTWANAAATTQRLSGTGAFIGATGCTADGIAGGTQFDIAASGNGETECALQLVAADLVDDDQVQFRLTRDGGVLIGTYAVTPTVIAVESSPTAKAGAVGAQGAFAQMGGW